jgi:hypothetical protein
MADWIASTRAIVGHRHDGDSSPDKSRQTSVQNTACQKFIQTQAAATPHEANAKCAPGWPRNSISDQKYNRAARNGAVPIT